MEREVELSQISDGKKYSIQDMAKLGCNDCQGCHACCENMGNSVILDPYDVYRITTGLNTTFTQLIGNRIDLNVVEGIILPNMKMSENTNCCSFLDDNGRCSIHQYRPGMCRIFPLGRLYENGDFSYILQVKECAIKNRSKVKIKKWIDTPEYEKNADFINQWHYFLKDLSAKLLELSEERVKDINMFILNTFYVTLYEGNRDFYEQFDERMKAAKEYI